MTRTYARTAQLEWRLDRSTRRTTRLAIWTPFARELIQYRPHFRALTCDGNTVTVETSPVQFARLVGQLREAHWRFEGRCSPKPPSTFRRIDVCHLEIEDVQAAARGRYFTGKLTGENLPWQAKPEQPTFCWF